jgi:ribosomal protein L37AE/L43A
MTAEEEAAFVVACMAAITSGSSIGEAIDTARELANKPDNDHICPDCKNDKVSKAEKAKGVPCWKCGGKL